MKEIKINAKYAKTILYSIKVTNVNLTPLVSKVAKYIKIKVIAKYAKKIIFYKEIFVFWLKKIKE